MKRLIIIALLLCLPVLAIADEAATTVPDAGGKKIDEAFMAAYSAVDIPAIVKMYAEDTTMAEAGLDAPVKGRAAMIMEDGSTMYIRADFTDIRKQNSKGEWQFIHDFVAFTPVMEDAEEAGE